MQWIPRQDGSYVISNIYVWMGRMLLSTASIFAVVRGLNMFDHIPEINIVIAMCAVAVLAWISLIQYSKYVQHIKNNLNSNNAKLEQAKEFAIIPYLLIPIIFGSLSVFAGLWVADYVSVKGYFAGTEEIAVIAIVATIVVNCILSKYLVSHVGDAIYFQTVENKVVKVVDEFPGVSDEDKEILKLLKALRK